MIPLITYPCDQKTIREFEKKWVEVLNADLNACSPLNAVNRWNNGKGKEVKRKLYYSNIQNKVFYCDICDKSFGWKSNLQKHLNTLSHSYAYLNSID